VTISSIIRDVGVIDAPVLVHFLAPLTVVVSGGAVPNGRVLCYGDELVVTDEVRKLNAGRDGESCFDYLDDEDAQVRQWGRVVMRRGAWPENVSRNEPGSAEWHEAREVARKAAHAIHDERAKYKALEGVAEDFGEAPSTSRTLRDYR